MPEKNHATDGIFSADQFGSDKGIYWNQSDGEFGGAHSEMKSQAAGRWTLPPNESKSATNWLQSNPLGAF